MSRRLTASLLLLLAAALALPTAAGADEWGLQSFRDPFAARDPRDDGVQLDLDGYLRLRGDRLHNFDLDRGATPSTGETLYPLPINDPQGNDTLSSANMRLRLEPTIHVGWEVAVHATLDCLDNVLLGGQPASDSRWSAMSAAATSQRPPSDSLQVRRAWAEIGTPLGMLMAGRMGVHWGLGMVANDGDCLDCDGGNTVDQIGLVSPLLGHIVGLSYAISSAGPSFDPWERDGQAVDADPADDVRTASLGLLRFTSPAVRAIKLAGGRHVLDYGLAVSRRWQQVDAPGASGDGAAPTAAQLVQRDFTGTLVDGYVSWETRRNLLELEVAWLSGHIGDATVIPGLSTDSVEASQYGGVVRDTVRALPWLQVVVEAGLASGDPAPGFGARPGRDRDRSRPGDLDGPQLDLPDDRRVDNFRFHPDYHVDLILWREIIGTITDAAYLRPSVRVGPALGVEAEVALIWSRALEASSTPGGEAALGTEIDVTLRYRSHDRFVAALEYGLLLPGAGLDNTALGLGAEPAQRLHALMGVLF